MPEKSIQELRRRKAELEVEALERIRPTQTTSEWTKPSTIILVLGFLSTLAALTIQAVSASYTTKKAEIDRAKFELEAKEFKDETSKLRSETDALKTELSEAELRYNFITNRIRIKQAELLKIGQETGADARLMTAVSNGFDINSLLPFHHKPSYEEWEKMGSPRHITPRPRY